MTDESNWRERFNSGEFCKWQYKETTYRVVVHLNDRGHYEALFTSVYGPPNYLIRGNCGGGQSGRMLARAAAVQWMSEEAPFGCPPPSELIA